MAEQCSEWFTQCDTTTFAFAIVGLSNIDRDHAFVVAGHHRRPAGRIAQKTKTQRRTVPQRRAIGRKSEAQKSVDDAALGDLQFVPEFAVVRNGQIGNDLIESARDAERIWILERNEPIAD